MHTATLRAGVAADLGAVRALLGAAALPADDLGPAHLANFIIATNDAEILGCIGIEILGEAALLRSAAVAESRRAGGLGNALLTEIEVHAITRGVRRLYLLTTTAEKFFARRGYEHIERSSAPPSIRTTTEFANICPASAICMAKTL